ncbi:hypothetical protein PQR02_17020 [Paraburkholderia sediminicola]|uniref:Uncharacterized protein n=1 Tax=Paraburkholderia rhynchosiae TaxID=487049 RepID=A0ACC7ND72_9BURK
MFGSTFRNAGATLRQYPYSATGMPEVVGGPIGNRSRRKKINKTPKV